MVGAVHAFVRGEWLVMEQDLSGFESVVVEGCKMDIMDYGGGIGLSRFADILVWGILQ